METPRGQEPQWLLIYKLLWSGNWKGNQQLDPGPWFLPHVKRVHHEALPGSPTRHTLAHKISWHGLNFFPLVFKKLFVCLLFFRQGSGKAHWTGNQVM